MCPHKGRKGDYMQNSDILILVCVGVATFAFVFSSFVFSKSNVMSVLGWGFAFENSLAATLVSFVAAVSVIELGYYIGQATGATVGYVFIAIVFPPTINRMALHMTR